MYYCLTKYFILLFLFLFVFTSCYKEDSITFITDFEIEVPDGNYSAPTAVSILNKSEGADRYKWTFEGGDPVTSNQKHPENIVFRQPGKHLIRLECWSGNRSEIKELELILDSMAIPQFKAEIQINAFAPADVKIMNQTSGSSYFKWTFEGGIPALCEEKTPPVVRYEQPGTYVIRFVSGSNRKQYEHTDTIRILPRLQSNFKLIPAFENEDYQAPAIITAENRSISALASRWEISGGSILDDTSTHPEIYFEQPGTYSVTLHTDNQKEQQTVSQTIHILPNTNLYCMKDVKMGISTSKNYGSFYSCRLRKSLMEKEIDKTNSQLIDFIFFALNDKFSYCRFISPDIAGNFIYSPIPQSIKTYIVNGVASSRLSFGMDEFESMNDDRIFKSFDIKAHDTGELYFQLETLPFFVLFETGDGRKGAICIKKMEKSGTESYIVTDIKVQKKKKL